MTGQRGVHSLKVLDPIGGVRRCREGRIACISGKPVAAAACTARTACTADTRDCPQAVADDAAAFGARLAPALLVEARHGADGVAHRNEPEPRVGGGTSAGDIQMCHSLFMPRASRSPLTEAS